ncbi:hypothetical protein NUU61_006475 [Penicillium alfredii]|uniref:N-acetyltransferase domain-containing protein n=1 Tax=Penicillium alfredii TaxID=1506179 RepID=A0A9W9K3N5_9EURO|nr:uncharacterized protein NUU61_006475 [Penicillium alfredii]KAJ5091605.1 hypothetical protein NUU61_006475 [Penicillium alfredii]
MAAPTPPAEEVILIPQSFSSPTHFHEIVDRYKKLRLQGLQVDPNSFSSTYAEESQFPAETWQSRIANPSGKTFISVMDGNKSPENTEENILEPSNLKENQESPSLALQKLLQKEWMGQITILGPEIFLNPEESLEETPNRRPWDIFIKDGGYSIPCTPPHTLNLDGAHIVYLVVGMFVLPQARRRGNARRLLEAAVQAVREEGRARGARAASIVLQVESGIDNAQRLYGRVGFQAWGTVVLQNRHGKPSPMVAMVNEVGLAD